MNILNDIAENLQKGKAKVVKEIVEQALAEGISAEDILKNGLMAGMDVVAVKFKNNEVYVPEVLVAARAMNMGTAVLKPHLKQDDSAKVGKAIIGTVKGDMHDIGKNLVRMMFEGKGIEVVDLGIDVSPEKFLEAFKQEKPDVIALSALLTTTMPEMKNTIDAFLDAGVREEVIFMIGGAPINEAYCKEIGADAYTSDAASAAELAKELIIKKHSI